MSEIITGVGIVLGCWAVGTFIQAVVDSARADRQRIIELLEEQRRLESAPPAPVVFESRPFTRAYEQLTGQTISPPVSRKDLD